MGGEISADCVFVGFMKTAQQTGSILGSLDPDSQPILTDTVEATKTHIVPTATLNSEMSKVDLMQLQILLVTINNHW